MWITSANKFRATFSRVRRYYNILYIFSYLMNNFCLKNKITIFNLNKRKYDKAYFVEFARSAEEII